MSRIRVLADRSCTTGKVGYSKREAQTTLNYLKHHRHGSKRLPTRVYLCSCGYHHITSKEDTEYTEQMPLIYRDMFKQILDNEK